MLGAGDKVAVRVRFRGTHRGVSQGVAATNVPKDGRSAGPARWTLPDHASASVRGRCLPSSSARPRRVAAMTTRSSGRRT
ncbi:hypothetical protein ABZ572_02975 [Streptomyces sp. NPDC018338]|uniref:hypothetical protein n=1 Tax=Streptomyces sp. NPDC018338 TaxID=3157192 RepID=UPI0033FCB805